MAVRDFLLNEALKRLAAEAATRFTTLVAGGDQVPFDVAEQEGPDSLFHSYVPLTARYVRERESELRSLPAWEGAREAVQGADAAAGYLEGRGEPVDGDPGRRAERMLVCFLAALWDGSTDFSLDRGRLDAALTVIEAESREASEADVLIAPIVGLRMNVDRLGLPHGAQVVRADSIEAPVDAMRSEGMGRAAWEPQYLAVAEQEEGADSVAEAMRQLHELISVLRLFKAGGVGLGPYAFAPTGEGNWRRIATGAPTARAGGYRLDEEEAERLTAFAEALEARPDPQGTLAWAVARFELGCERESALSGLSDHLLALRAVLDGQGPVGASLPMRAAALVEAGSERRLQARERIEEAMQLEHALMRGAAATGSLELATWLEGNVRGLLRSAALGELEGDLGEAADENLIAGGLGAGDSEIAVTAFTPEVAEISAVPETSPGMPASEAEDIPVDSPAPLSADDDRKPQEVYMEEETRILEPVPAEGEIRITANNWLEEVEAEEDGGTIEWPAGHSSPQARERIDTPRVRRLFEVPEDADWEVRELRYDHYERRRAG